MMGSVFLPPDGLERPKGKIGMGDLLRKPLLGHGESITRMEPHSVGSKCPALALAPCPRGQGI